MLDDLLVETIGFCERDNVTREVFYKRGEMGPSKQFWAIGRFSNGSKVGTHWKWTRGNSFLVGSLDDENKAHGDHCFFLYPNLITILFGKFEHGKMKSANNVKLVGFRTEYGIAKVKLQLFLMVLGSVIYVVLSLSTSAGQITEYPVRKTWTWISNLSTF
jgi:hypothetical protein